MSLLLWTHSHSTDWFQIHIMKCMEYFVIHKFWAVAKLTVLTSVLQKFILRSKSSGLKASVKKISFSTSAKMCNTEH